MRSITPTPSLVLAKHVGNDVVRRVAPYTIESYPELVREVAALAYQNKDYLLFYRGQDRDYLNKAGSSSYYPTIYRKDVLTAHEIRLRFDMLELAEHLLAEAFDSGGLEGRQDVRRKSYIAWSILQHYKVCDTPLLDFTHSLRAAATFAQYNNREERGIVAVFGLPYTTNRITYNSEHDLVIVRLLSICPPLALRPYFQEGYLAGTLDITRDYIDKSELDFNNRLVAKFSIPNNPSFWGKDFAGIPEPLLFPPDDRMAEICARVKTRLIDDMKNVFMT
ncbi:MAG: FRG domain-containing protein [Chloroflexi bacterium]|nr:FRG domain-containing protein [Chloroflexota bacterium]